MHRSNLRPCCPAETITGDPTTGSLLLPDKLGAVHLAHRLPNGSYSLQQKPLAQTGPGRVLGSKLDADGRLVMCDVSKVRPPCCGVPACAMCAHPLEYPKWCRDCAYLVVAHVHCGQYVSSWLPGDFAHEAEVTPAWDSTCLCTLFFVCFRTLAALTNLCHSHTAPYLLRHI
jgi:hypothetical protein